MSIEDRSVAERARRPVIVERRVGPSHCADCMARHQSFCNVIGDDDIAYLNDLSSIVQFVAGTNFIDVGMQADSFYNVSKGTARVFKLLPDGRRQIIGFAGPGHFLGLPAKDVYNFSAEAIDDMRLCRFSRRQLHILMDNYPAVERRLLDMTAHELALAQEQMLLLGRKTARERVASFLVAEAEKYHVATRCGSHASVTLHIPMLRSDMADYLGLTIETVSRTLTRMRTEFLITILKSGDIQINELARMQELSTAG